MPDRADTGRVKHNTKETPMKVTTKQLATYIVRDGARLRAIALTAELVELGQDYATFQSAQAANRSLKRALRALCDAERAF